MRQLGSTACDVKISAKSRSRKCDGSTAIVAFSGVVLGCLDWERNDYRRIEVDEQAVIRDHSSPRQLVRRYDAATGLALLDAW